MRKNGVNAQAVPVKSEAAKLILEKAEDLDAANIIVRGFHGHRLLHKALLDGVSESVIRHAQRSGMVVTGAGS